MKKYLIAGLFLALSAVQPAVQAHGGGERPPVVVPAELAVRSALPAPEPGVTDLRFREMFRMPVGPKGLEASEKLQALDGQRVRMVGYVVATESPVPGRLILSPVPVSIGDEDESLSDDLPPNAVFVHLSGTSGTTLLPDFKGLIQLTGRLSVGARDEADGRVSGVRLLLDESLSRVLATGAPVSISAQR